jgi:hydroxymethylpyrimidine pyrophosphatase-like HAD family hydrolase
MSEVNALRRFSDALLVLDLHLALEDVAGLLEVAIAAGDPLDAYLLAAGASQAVRDVLEDDPAALLRSGSHATSLLPSVLARPVMHGARVLSRAIVATRDAAGARRPLEEAADRIDALVTELASDALTGEWHPDAAKLLAELLDSGTIRNGPARKTSLTLPSCFRSFDLHPRDVQRLARTVACRVHGPAPRILVLGVRTSGSYLAPLLAAALRFGGVEEVEWRTIRPGRTPSPSLRQLIAERANAAWSLVVVDDPPDTGRALGRAARQAVELGFPVDAVCLAFALHEGGAVPASLSAYSCAVLDWTDWDIHGRLGTPTVERLLAEHPATRGALASVTPVALPERPSLHGHARAGYTATFADGAELTVVAEGTGLGYLGRHALAVAQAMGTLVPEVLAFDDGILLRHWLSEESRAALDTPDRVQEAVDYVTARRTALPARHDAAASMAGRQPAWEVASRLLAAPYRELGLALRAVALDAAVQALLAPRHPSVVDGLTGPGAWFLDNSKVVKVGFAERAFSHLDVACYDATYDLAGLTVDSPDASFVSVAVARYEDRTGEPVDPERLLLYRLVHLWDRARLDHLAAEPAEAAMARAWQDWSRARLLDGPLDGGHGPWCVLDVDGVLETSRLGAPTLTPASAAGLRALRAHGFRPLLATGRGFADVQDRCARYGLLGGVAEYGGVVYDHRRGVVQDLVDDRGAAALATLREHLEHQPGVAIAGGSRTMIRAYRVDRLGRRRGLDTATIDAARPFFEGRVGAIPGIVQTDFVAFGVDKGHGVRALLDLLGAPGESPALCVGDSESDVPMLRLATTARVPAHAAALAGHGIVATRAAFQRGFAEAVDDVVGHDQTECTSCAPVPIAPGSAQLVQAILRGLEGGRTTGLAAMPGILRSARDVSSTARREGTLPASA